MTGNQAHGKSQELLAPFKKGLLKLNLSIFSCYISEGTVPSVMVLSEDRQAVICRIVPTK